MGRWKVIVNEMLLGEETIVSVEILDEGVSITTDAQTLNFIGDGVTAEEVSLGVVNITISTTPIIQEGEFCPGYAFTRVDGNSIISALDLDLTSLFSSGRRVKIDTDKYGVVDTSTYGTGTTVNLTMEDAATIDIDPSTVCLTSSTTSWVQIASSPFTETINDIATGVIAGTQWWIAVGNGGQVAASNDGGVTFSLLTTTTTKNINCCCYDSTHDTFWAGGDGGVLLSTTDGAIVIEDTTSIPALVAAGGNYDINGIVHGTAEDLVMIQYSYAPTSHITATTIDQGVTWTSKSTSTNVAGNHSLNVEVVSEGITNTTYAVARVASSSTYRTALSTSSWGTGDSASPVSGTPASLGFFWTGASTKVYGTTTGGIAGYSDWTGDDDTSFNQQINDFAYSALLRRMVCVANNGTIGYWEQADKADANAWNVSQNGFSPLTNINAVGRNEVDGVFIAVGGTKICRSTNGIS